MAPKKFATIFGLAMIIFGCTRIPEGLQPITGFELERYLGKWYEIARLDHSFERNLSNVSATYVRTEKGDIRVINRGFNSKTGAWKQIDGYARFLDSETLGSLKVSFFRPFYSGYHIIVLDRQRYSYAMVTGPSRSYLWILSRRQTMGESTYAALVSKAGASGFDTSKLIRIDHNLPGESTQPFKNTNKANTKGEAKMITPCPSTPNCVSSIDKDRKHFIEPLRFSGSDQDAKRRLLDLLGALKRTSVKTIKENYILAESVSTVMRFVDDVEFFFDDHKKLIHVKSASRVGYSDLGVNRRRIEKIRKLFNATNKNSQHQ